MQYTIRNIPKKLDAELRRRAKAQGKSLNEVALEALAEGAGLKKPHKVGPNLNFVIGTMGPDPELDQAPADQRRIDPELWK